MRTVSGILRVYVIRIAPALILALFLGVTWGGGGMAAEASHLPNLVAVISVDDKPLGVGVHAPDGKVYVANESSGNVSVINSLTNQVTATITVGSMPGNVAVDAANDRVYVSNFGSGNVSVINSVTDSEIVKVTVGSQPHGVAVKTGKAFVANAASNTVSVINTATNTVADTITVGSKPVGISYSVDLDRVYVSNESANNVTVLNGTTHALVATIPTGAAPSYSAVNDVTDRLYVANAIGDSVSVVDTSANSVIATIPVGDEPRGVGVDASTNRVYVSNRYSNSISVIDGFTNSVVQTVPVGTEPHVGVAVSASTGRVYVANLASDNVYVLSFPSHPLGASLVNFQGRLTDNLGNPVANGNYSVTFRIYDASVGGTVKWQETQTVAVSGSVFSVLLGSVVPLEGGHFNGEPRYLEVQIAADPPLSPRQQFTSVPNAFNAQSLDGLGASQFLRRDTSGTLIGNLTVNGTVESTSGGFKFPNGGVQTQPAWVVLYVGSAQSCPAGFSLLMNVDAGVSGSDASSACSGQGVSQLFYIGSTQTCPSGWTQVDINAAVVGTTAADACFR